MLLRSHDRTQVDREYSVASALEVLLITSLHTFCSVHEDYYSCCTTIVHANSLAATTPGLSADSAKLYTVTGVDSRTIQLIAAHLQSIQNMLVYSLPHYPQFNG
jgi:hypothetical protein